MEVRRDRTAIARPDLSRPVQLLIGNGVLTPEHTFFDYGCGLGDDVRFLRSLGYHAHGWDPAHQPDEAQRSAAVVNLGYVLNVIERPAERAAALRRAFDLTGRCLCVAVMVGAATYSGEAQSYGDGLLTSRRTFQKYYHQEEARRYLEEILDVEPIPLQAGVFLIFRQTADAHAFLLNRIQRSTPLMHGVPRERRRALRTALIETFRAEHADEWAAYADFAASRARPPVAGELDALRVAAEHGVAPADLWAAASEALPQEHLAEQRRRHTYQYLTFMAICRFRGTPRLRDLPVTARYDIRHFFRSYSHLKQLSGEHLFAAGDAERVARLRETAAAGVNTADGYFVARRDLPALDPTLQIYARLGELFAGDLDSVDVIKVHKTSPRLSLFSLIDAREALPRLKSRVKIDLQSQQVRFFDHSTNPEPELLVGKQLLGFDEGSTDARAISVGRRLLMQDEPFGLIVPVARVTQRRRVDSSIRPAHTPPIHTGPHVPGPSFLMATTSLRSTPSFRWRSKFLSASNSGVPQVPGVYALGHIDGYYGLEVSRVYVYVGETTNLQRRLCQHLPDTEQNAPLREYLRHNYATARCWYAPIPGSDIKVIQDDLIRRLRPAFNILGH